MDFSIALCHKSGRFRKSIGAFKNEKIRPVRKAVLPVAGLGTRLLPATKAMPKEMLTIVDRPLIQMAIEEARQAGIEEFILS